MSEPYRSPSPEELSMLAELFPTLRGLPGVRPWHPQALARHVPIVDAADPTMMAACALAILFRLDPARFDATVYPRNGIMELFRQLDPAALCSGWDEAHWQAFLAFPLPWRRFR